MLNRVLIRATVLLAMVLAIPSAHGAGPYGITLADRWEYGAPFSDYGLLGDALTAYCVVGLVVAVYYSVHVSGGRVRVIGFSTHGVFDGQLVVIEFDARSGEGHIFSGGRLIPVSVVRR